MSSSKQTDALKYYLNWLWREGSSLKGNPESTEPKSAPEDMFDGMIEGCDRRNVAGARDLNAVTRFVFHDGSRITVEKWCGWWQVDDRIKMIEGREYVYSTATDEIIELSISIVEPGDRQVDTPAANSDEGPPDAI